MSNFGTLRPQQTPAQAGSAMPQRGDGYGFSAANGAAASDYERFWLQICVKGQWSNVAQFEKGLVALNRVAELVEMGGFQELKLVRAKQNLDGTADYQTLASFAPGHPLFVDDSLKPLFGLMAHSGLSTRANSAAQAAAYQAPPDAPAGQNQNNYQQNYQQNQHDTFYGGDAINTQQNITPHNQASDVHPDRSQQNAEDEAILNALANYDQQAVDSDGSYFEDSNDILPDGTYRMHKAKRSMVGRLLFLFGFVLVVVSGLGYWLISTGGQLPTDLQFLRKIPFIGDKIANMAGDAPPAPVIQTYNKVDLQKKAASISNDINQMAAGMDKPAEGSDGTQPPADADLAAQMPVTNVPALPPLKPSEINPNEIKALQPAPSVTAAKPTAVKTQDDVKQNPTAQNLLQPTSPAKKAAPEKTAKLSEKPATLNIEPKEADKPPQAILPNIKESAKPKQPEVKPPEVKPPEVKPPEVKPPEAKANVADELASLTPSKTPPLSMDLYRKIMLGFHWSDTKETMSPALDNCRPADEQFTVCRLRSTPRFAALAGVIAQFDRNDGDKLVALQLYGKPNKGVQDAKDQFEAVVKDVREALPAEQKGFDTRRVLAGSEFFASLKEDSNRASYFTYWPDNNGQYPVFVYAKLVALSKNEGYYHILIGKPKSLMGPQVQ